MKHNKSKLKEGYYYEELPFYDMLPDTIEVPVYQTEIFETDITHREILEKYKIVPYTLEQAVGVVLDVIPTLKNDYKGRLVYFNHEGKNYRFCAFRDDGGQLNVFVIKLDLGFEWDAGFGASFSNVPLETKEVKTLSNSETLTLSVGNFTITLEELEKSIDNCKKAGYKIIKEF